MSGARLLVVGARPGSLGAAVAEVAASHGYAVLTAGLNEEGLPMDALLGPLEAMRDNIADYDPEHLICTVGFNMPMPEGDKMDVSDWYRWHFEINVTAPMRILRAWELAASARQGYRHFVAVSSNSAHLPRSRSAAYCASKAALSMALRVAARDGVGGDKHGILIYGYEPGLLAGTPMTQLVKDRLPGMALHRMRGAALEDGIDPWDLAELMVTNLTRGPAINGSLIPFAADEL